MTSPLSQFVGKEVNIYGPESADHDGFIEAGTLVGVEGDFLLLSQGDARGPNVAVHLTHVMVVAVRDQEPQLKPIAGGKVHRFRRENPEGPFAPSPEPPSGSDDGPGGKQ